MATLFEIPMQSERDLRSANKEFKRSKDATARWRYGGKPASGCHLNLTTNETEGGSEEQRSKVRPMGRFSEESSYNKKVKSRMEHNIVKTNRANYDLPFGRVKSKMSAAEEVLASINDLPSPDPTQLMSFSDHVLYSFDRAETPGKPLSLDLFIKQPTGRDTERLVEKEYEILDGNGEPLKGRKARSILRKSGSDLASKDGPVEDDDFELV
jgi:hypothetical protein